MAAKSGKFSEFKERCFGLLGYTAAAVLYHMDKFKNFLQNHRSNNLLIQACGLYINTDFIIVELQCLAWFTRKVTMPFLDMCEIKKHSELLIILPQLKNDLEEVKLTTLSEYEVDYSFDVHQPQSPLRKNMVAEFYKKESIDLTTQRGREYGFAVRSLGQLKLTNSQRSNLIIFLSTVLNVREVCQFLVVLKAISIVCIKRCS